MTTISTLPTAPSRADPATFSDRSDALLGALDTFVSETNTVAGEVNANAATATTQAALATTNGATQVSLAEAQVALATTQATNAAISAAAAASSALVAGATIWVSGTSYTIGGARYSPLNGQVYRRLTNGAGTTDPSADTTNWIVVNGITSEAISLPVNNLPTIRPTLLLDFANSKIVDSRIAFTRASTATYVNAFGRLSSSAINAPRIDYDPVTLACKGLLIEESRTNLLTYSEQFDNAAWVKTRSSVSANAAAAPDGTTTADKLVEDNTANNTHYTWQQYTASNTTVTFSVYVKAAERTYSVVKFSNNLDETWGIQVNLNTPTDTAVLGGIADGVDFKVRSYKVTPMLNGWVRISLTSAKQAVNTAIACEVSTHNGTSPSYTGDGASGIYIWGAQLEAGAFATSYIPTTSAQVTRAADVATMTGTNFSSWYRQDEFTSVVQFVSNTSVAGNAIVYFSDSTPTNSVIAYQSGTTLYMLVYSGSSQVASINLGTITNGATHKLAFAWKVNDFASSLDGGAVVTDTAGALPIAMDRLNIGSSPPGILQSDTDVLLVMCYPQRLPNATLQALSTL